MLHFEGDGLRILLFYVNDYGLEKNGISEILLNIQLLFYKAYVTCMKSLLWTY